MKNILLLAFAFSVFSLVSCNDCEDCGDNKSSDPVFQVRPESLIFSSDSNEPQIIDVITSYGVSWKAEVETSAQDWLTITDETGKIIVRAAENTALEQRTGKIIIIPDNEALKPVEVSVLQYDVPVINIDVTKAVLIFQGDLYDCGLANYYMIMGNGDIEFTDEYHLNIDRRSMNDGYWIFFDILTEEISAEMYQNVYLEEGTYKNSMYRDDEDFEFEKMSFLITHAQEDMSSVYLDLSYILKFKDGKVVDWFEISEGKITVSNDNGDYTIAADLTSSDGEKIIIHYSDEFDATVNLVALSTYTNDLELSGLNTGTLEFYGVPKDTWGQIHDGCYQWIIRIDTPGYDNVSELRLILDSSMTSTTVPDDSIYTFGYEIYEPFIAEMGWIHPFFGETYGSWVLGLDGGEVTDSAPLFKGTVEVTHNGGDNYTIEVDAIMDNFYTVKASFEGDLEYIDMTADGAQPMPPLKMSTAKALRNTGIREKMIIDKINLYE